MSVLFVDALTVIDFTYLDATRGLVGESWIVDLELHGALDEQGMVLDFGNVKKTVKREIDRLADHRLIVPAALPGLEIVELPDDNLRIAWTDAVGHLLIECPPAAVLQLGAAEVTPQALTSFLTVALRSAVPDTVERIVVRLREEDIDGAYYHYSHGLKKHDGACQRIAHGHRSRIAIEENGTRRADLEQRWASLFRDIYIGTTDDLTYTPSNGHVRFAYVSREGRYLLELPRARVYLIDTDSTVEHIAQHIATALRRDNPQHRYRVKAYEGVAKGAIGTA
ncbi:MAG: 6-pyruvoyl trahydropterin synthase family protein [Pseudomonadota bacterium]